MDALKTYPDVKRKNPVFFIDETGHRRYHKSHRDQGHQQPVLNEYPDQSNECANRENTCDGQTHNC